MTFQEAIATQPDWVRYWGQWMGIVIFGSMLTLFVSRVTRIDAFIIAGVSMATFFAMTWLYDQVGYVRLLGLVHVVLWVPLVIYLVRRLRDPAIESPFRQVIWMLVATMCISLACDFADVGRYVLGERESLIPA